MTGSQTSAERAAPTTDTVAVLGAGGTMGFAMARNIARAGLKVRVWNRSRDKAEPLASDGAVVTDTPAEAAQDATIVLTMLADADAVFSAMDGEDGALPVMASGALDLPYLRMKSQAIAKHDFTPSFRLTLAAKDADLVSQAAQRHGMDLPLLDLIARRLREGTAKHGEKDFSATYLTSAPVQ